MNALPPRLFLQSSAPEKGSVMKKVSVVVPFETLALDIDGTEVVVRVNVSSNYLGPISQLCKENGTKMIPLDEEKNRATKDRDFDRVDRINHEEAELIEPILVAALGKDDYEKILESLGRGTRINPAYCIESLVQIMKEISSVVRDHFGISAAQMTAGAADALQTTDIN